jgi:ferredoxin
VKSLRITIDPIACTAYGYCAELLPEGISLDEWGYPVINDGRIPAELLALARRAARDCPRRAITVKEVDDGPPTSRPVRVGGRRC